MVDFAPGMRTIIRDEEWMIKKIETNSLGNKTYSCTKGCLHHKLRQKIRFFEAVKLIVTQLPYGSCVILL